MGLFLATYHFFGHHLAVQKDLLSTRQMNGGVPYLMKQSVPVMQGARGGAGDGSRCGAIVNHQSPGKNGTSEKSLLHISPLRLKKRSICLPSGSRKNHATF